MGTLGYFDEPRKEPKLQPVNYSAYQFLHDGGLALSDISQTGILIDQQYVLDKMEIARRKEEVARKKADDTKLVHHWKKVYGHKFNLDSDNQLSYMLFEKMGITATKFTDKDNPSVDQAALENLSVDGLDHIINVRKWYKVRGTYLGNILREVNDDGYLRPFFNLHTTATYRSSSSNINFQNIPIRDPDVGNLIRGAFLPRPGRMLLEVDYGGIEIRIAYCYHQDPMMKKYLLDPTKDMHFDMGMECYKVSREQMTDDIRFCSKNGFVFPSFYGSYHENTAGDLWNLMTKMRLETADGVLVKEHLKDKGIKGLKTFKKHIEKVDKDFWNERFAVYNDWKDEWYDKYEKKGYFDTLTGFRCQGVMRRNQVINYPVQGSAFHCLLWSVIKIKEWIKEEGLLSLVIGQIHDSIVFDVVPEEKDYLLENINRIMTESIREYWDWIIIPLEIDAELTPIDLPWSEKEKVKLAA